jgi:dTDP-4-dehydrorhamnose 3,5-epimerase
MREQRATAAGPAAPRIHGVRARPLRIIPDERGWLMEILRADDPDLFLGFGQVYVTATYPGVVKAWHYHRAQTDNLACVAGMVKLALVDRRPGSPTEGAIDEFVIGALNPMLVQVPALVCHGWKCLGDVTALVVNTPTVPYRRDDPDEFRIAPHGVIPYDWSRADG